MISHEHHLCTQPGLECQASTLHFHALWRSTQRAWCSSTSSVGGALSIMPSPLPAQSTACLSPYRSSRAAAAPALDQHLLGDAAVQVDVAAQVAQEVLLVQQLQRPLQTQRATCRLLAWYRPCSPLQQQRISSHTRIPPSLPSQNTLLPDQAQTCLQVCARHSGCSLRV